LNSHLESGHPPPPWQRPLGAQERTSIEYAHGDGDHSPTCLAYRLFASVLGYRSEDEVHLN
jgi:hypothetical protein